MNWLREVSNLLTAFDNFMSFTYFDAIDSIVSRPLEISEIFLSPLSGLDQYGPRGCHPLHYAIQSKSQAAIDWILSQGPPINSVTEIEGLTAAHCAVIQNDSESLRKLIERGANLNAFDQERMTPLSYAKTDLEYEKWAYQVPHLNFLIRLGPLKRNYLHFFAKDSTVHLLNWVIEASHWIINSRDIEGTTPLMIAAESGQVKATLALLLEGAAYDLEDEKGRMAIHRAAASGQCATCKLLLFEPNLFKTEPIDDDFFVEIESEESHDRLKSIALLFVQDSDGLSPLMVAVINGHVETVQFLCGFPEHLNLAHPETGDTALHYAVQNNSPKMVSALLDAFADPDPRNRAGLKPLDLLDSNLNDDPSQNEIFILLAGSI